MSSFEFLLSFLIFAVEAHFLWFCGVFSALLLAFSYFHIENYVQKKYSLIVFIGYLNTRAKTGPYKMSAAKAELK